MDKRILIREIKIRKSKLNKTDYFILKYVEGVISASEMISIKNDREIWRKEINQLEEELKKYE